MEFTELSQDCQLTVLRYLNIKERVRLERVNKRIAELIAAGFRSQLVLNYGAQKDFEECLNKSHHVRFLRDTVQLRISLGRDIAALANEPRPAEQIRPRIGSLVRRMPNLKALYVSNYQDRSELEECSKLCPKLEHLYIEESEEGDEVPDFFRLEWNGLECLTLHDMNLTADGAKNVVNFIKQQTKLSYFEVGECHDEESYRNLGPRFLAVVRNRSNLKKLVIDDSISSVGLEKVMKALRECVNLKSFSIVNQDRLKAKYQDVILKDILCAPEQTGFNQLQELALTIEQTGALFQQFIKRIGTGLKKLFIEGIGDDELDRIIDYCPNLTDLSIMTNRIQVRRVWSLSKLQEFELYKFCQPDVEMSRNEFDQLFSCCKKLRVLNFPRCRPNTRNRGHTECCPRFILDQLIEYARKFPKRTIEAELALNVTDYIGQLLQVPNLRVNHINKPVYQIGKCSEINP